MDEKLFDDNILGETHAYYTIIDHEICNQGGSQGSYNVKIKLFRYLIKNNIIEPDYELDYAAVDETNGYEFKLWAYTLKENYSFKLGPGALWIMGEKNNDSDNQFSFVFALDDLNSDLEKVKSSDFKVKPQIRRTVCEKKWDERYDWFVKLYDRNISGNNLIFKIDDENFILDVHFNSIDDSLSMEDIESDSYDDYSYPHNWIFFGAPGTGKSHALNNLKSSLLVNNENYERVSFHPDYSYANFVGTYKPVSKKNDKIKDKSDEYKISYEFVPGPFINVLVDSIKDPSYNPHLLVIEEINRSNVAAVFGDVFQLLDRKNGRSEYPIKASKDLQNYLKLTFEDDYENKFPNDEIVIPENMYIWATMNSADQGVFMMDTAFKRRWDFLYFGINRDSDKIKDVLMLVSEKNDKKIYWNELRESINEELLSFNVNEDKLLGPFFVKLDYLPMEDDYNKFNEDNDKFEINGARFYGRNSKFKELFKNKVIMYLFDDVAKHKRNELFDKGEKKYLLFSDICDRFDNEGIGIFSETIQDNYNDKVKKRNN